MADMSFLIDFCIDYRTYLCWQVSSFLFSIIISSFYMHFISICLNNLSFLEAKTTSPATMTVSGSYLTQLYNISLSQQVDIDIDSLLDLICPSFSKIFQSIFKLLDRICWLTRIPSVKKFSPWSNYMEYKRKVLWTTTNKSIWILYFKYMYFKISTMLKLSANSLTCIICIIINIF